MKGLLMINLGSPDSTSIPDVKKYLDEFLMDKRVIGKSYIFRWILVKLIILNFRPKKSAKAYKKIWWKEGSPLIVLSKRLKEKLEKKVDIPVELAMRYGNPSIKYGLDSLSKKGVNEILLIPLYPQFAMATTETILVLAEEIKNKLIGYIEVADISKVPLNSHLRYFTEKYDEKKKKSSKVFTDQVFLLLLITPVSGTLLKTTYLS
jgi:ferrochelatase